MTFPLGRVLYGGKPNVGTRLITRDGGINRSCKGAWLLGDNRSGKTALWRDSSISRLDATLPTQGNPGTSVPGRFGGTAFRALRNTNILQTANYTPPTSGFTVNIWVWAFAWSNFQLLFSQWNGGASKASWALAGFGDAKIYAYASSNGTNFREYHTNATMPTAQWFMVTAVYQASGTSILIYINGVAQSTSTSGDQAYSGIFNTAQPIYFGYSPSFGGAGAQGLDGRLECATIDERILSADEILFMYRSQYGRWEKAPNKARYKPSTAVDYVLTGAFGSFTETGETASLSAGRKLASDFGSFTLSGQAAGLGAAYKIVAGQGAYALSGQAATLKLDGKIPAAYGAYALTGEPALPKLDTTFANLFPGMFVLDGQDVEMERTTHWTDEDCTDSPWAHDECDCH